MDGSGGFGKVTILFSVNSFFFFLHEVWLTTIAF